MRNQHVKTIKSFAEERTWQMEKLKDLPDDLANLIKATMAIKAKGLGL